jgi:murein L,D-transpeptidase YafK
MIRTTVLRALVLTAAFAAALTPVTCLGENSNRLPTKATKKLPPELLSLLRQKKMPIHSPILVRVFKEEAELEVWKQDTTGRFQILKTYPICRWSGDLGPKLQEGDRQTPEGFYRVTPELMNPHSNYYLAINIGYPNNFDKANNRDGSLLMIHGNCWSSGCYAMTDEQISEIYALARDSFLGGRPSFQVQAYPFRLTPANLARHRNNPNLAFWKMLKLGNDNFETTRLEPKVDVCNRLYVFDAQRPPSSPKPLVFNPTDKCPAFVVNPRIARRALEKQRADELEYAQLLEDSVPAAPIYSELDGGMNKVFLARFSDRVTLSKRLGLDLAQGALVGELMSINISYAKRFENSYYRPGTKWAYVIMFDPSQEKKNYSELDERADYFYEAVTSSKGMVSMTPGIGQAYLGAYKDKNDKWFDGGKTYKLTVPPNPPAKQFWSLTIYDTYNRIGIDNKTQNTDLSSRDEGLRKNPDGSVDLYVGPEAPAEYEKNWLQTNPGEAWFAYFRLYGPLEPYLSWSWKLPDFEDVAQTTGAK